MKKIRVLILAAVLALALPMAAWAATSWTVTYTSGGEMSDNFSSGEFVDQVEGMQPGDSQTFEVALKHENSEDADWYMSNEVTKTLLEGSETSAYGYLLEYSGPGGSRTLYDSDTVGGEGTEGLKEATDALEDWLYLDTLSKGDSGSVTLTVTLDGETEGNDYFDTLADLKMAFAVEPVVEPGEPENRVIHRTVTRTRTVVQTGDDTDLVPFYIAMVASGALLAALAGYGVYARRRDNHGAHVR